MEQDITLEKAIEMLLSEANNIDEIEKVSLFEAVGRVAAIDITARMDNPPFDRSPLDGYALISQSTKGANLDNPVKFKIIGEECAGDFFSGTLKSNEALRIMTGAAIPKGADCVIRQEDVETQNNELFVSYELNHHENYCFAGEDIKTGDVIVQKNQLLNAACVGVFASQGFTDIEVYKKVRIAIASTGDELVMPGSELKQGKIYNSNLYTLAARLKELGFEAEVFGILPDDVNDIVNNILPRCDDFDLLITTGGVSVGKKDIMHEVVDSLGRKIFWRVMMKPGAPVLTYKSGTMLGIALSGNPFAAFATFELLVRPLLSKLSRRDLMYKRIEAKLMSEFPKESKGRRVIRAHYSNGEVYLPKQHASGSLFSASKCNAFVEIKAGTGKLQIGSKVELILL